MCKSIRDVSIGVFFLVAAGFLIFCMSWLIGLRTDINTQLETTRMACLVEISHWRVETKTQLTGLQRQIADERVFINSELQKIHEDANYQLNLARENLNAQITGLRADLQVSLNSVQALTDASTKATENVAAITDQVNKALPDFLDCSDANSNCLFNRYVGVAWSTELAMRSIRDNLPPIMKSVESTSASVASTAASVEKMAKSMAEKPPWWVTAIGWATSFGSQLKIIFGSFE